MLFMHDPAGGFSVFAGVGERTREGNDLYREMIESVSAGICFFHMQLSSTQVREQA
jgi:F0F1-type ATP synthase beta subunit